MPLLLISTIFWAYIRIAGELWRHYAHVTSPALMSFQICTLVNSTMMLCPAPSIPFRAPLQDIWNSPHDTGHPVSHDLINASVTFLCSSMCFPINAPFVIHYNPQFDDFPEPDRIRSFRIYYPHNHRHLEVKVGPLTFHDDVMTLKRIAYYCPFGRDIHRSPVDSHPKCGSSIGISCWSVKALEETVDLWAIRVTPRAHHSLITHYSDITWAWWCIHVSMESVAIDSDNVLRSVACGLVEPSMVINWIRRNKHENFHFNCIWNAVCRVTVIFKMTSSNGNIFRVAGHLCGEFTCHQWIPRTKASDA